MKLLDEVKFQRQDGTRPRVWLAWEAGDVKILFVDGGPGSIVVEIARDLDGDGISEPARAYVLNPEAETAFLEAKVFAATALRPREPESES